MIPSVPNPSISHGNQHSISRECEKERKKEFRKFTGGGSAQRAKLEESRQSARGVLSGVAMVAAAPSPAEAPSVVSCTGRAASASVFHLLSSPVHSGPSLPSPSSRR